MLFYGHVTSHCLLKSFSLQYRNTILSSYTNHLSRQQRPCMYFTRSSLYHFAQQNSNFVSGKEQLHSGTITDNGRTGHEGTAISDEDVKTNPFNCIRMNASSCSLQYLRFSRTALTLPQTDIRSNLST